ncbi:MAG: UDP-4-amino-4,6-dideoxy-N-acetyl-beta-L-altrosamine transaminase [Pseudomonadota bacterium]
MNSVISVPSVPSVPSVAKSIGERSSDNGERPYIPYGRQSIDEDDIAAVVEVLRSDWLTTGPKVAEFEGAVADYVGAKEAVAVNSGTAALHAVMYAIGIGPGDEVIVPPMTFAATANAVVMQGATPVFADVCTDTLLINPDEVETKITSRTRAIVAVDYAGHPCDYDALKGVAGRHGLFFIADACHALGAEYKGRKVGSLADLTVFSFHPVKHITTGEGGMITTNVPRLADRMRKFRNHGITRDAGEFTVHGSRFTVEGNSTNSVGQRSTVNGERLWYYEMQELGYNYRITDIQCALGISQLRKLPRWIERRKEIAGIYDRAFADVRGVEPLNVRTGVLHAYHLYVIRVDPDRLGMNRDEVFCRLQANGVGVNVHYIPVHLHPFYKRRFGCRSGNCPVAEKAYEQIITIPLFNGLSDNDVEYVCETFRKVTKTAVNR